MKLIIVILLTLSLYSTQAIETSCCEYKGHSYDIGEKFKDDCNDCTCLEGGGVSCTLKLCYGCESVLCLEGTTCVIEDNRPICKSNVESLDCSAVLCEEGTTCVMENNSPVCKSNVESSGCEALQCLEGSECQMGPNGAICVPLVIETPLTCEYNGMTFNDSDSFPSSDGCNQCSCNNGTVICTMMACVEVVTCNYQDQEYNDEEIFPAGDGCNTCFCCKGEVHCSNNTCEINCKNDDDCDSGYFCSKNSCGDSQEGICSECNSETICATEYEPVCGCDGQTYGNLCEATRACVNVHCSGECESTESESQPEPQPEQPASCQLDTDCDSGYFCTKDSCDAQEGTCTECNSETLCTEEYQPVCGCDDQTYSNQCDALRSCVNVKYSGECQLNNPQPQSQPQYCHTQEDCDSGYFCEKESCSDSDMGICSECDSEMICDTEYDPVCGCDEQTYSNSCEAARACVNVHCAGECQANENQSQPQPQPEQPASCQLDTDCDSGYFCTKDSCDDSEPGTCIESNSQMACTKEYEPVCGCDGQTYGNRCEATRFSVNVRSDGECESTEYQPEQQTSCQSDNDCDSGYFCTKDSCDAQEGTCTQCNSETICATEYEPVCGCDGQTYGNQCEATRACVNVHCSGECEANESESTESQPQPQPEQPASCQSDNDCDSEYFCTKDSCDAQEGTCVERNSEMACTKEYEPVCGCDGKTYGNRCEATRNFVNVRSDGECESTESESQPQSQPQQQTSCKSDNDCDSTDYCAKETCDCDKGTCTKRSSLCTRLYDPVCGCDGQTYSNHCEAGRTGVNVRSNGECTSQSGSTPYSNH